ncbi:MAG TPA: hypothetical protein VF284_04600 [Rhodanobacteraceae bacterium]
MACIAAVRALHDHLGSNNEEQARKAVIEAELFSAPLRDAEHHSAKREQGAHVRAQGWATKSARTADLNAAGGPERQ